LENNPNSNAEYFLYISSLIHRLREREVLNEQETKDLDEWRKPGGREAVFQELMDRKRFVAGVKEMNEYDGEEAVDTIFSRLGLRTPLQVRRMAFLKRGMAVAAVFLLAVAGVWLLMRQPSAPPAEVVKKDVGPGGNKAMLTLANGTKILLDTVQRGAIASQGSSRVLKTDDGRLAYEPVTKKTTSLVYNTLSTPRGGQYQLTLPDGSRVWLNAASSITYPTAFAGNERKVSITGEAYIEVVHSKDQPFRVQAGDQLVEDMGTAFNINAYSDEPVIMTTLVAGKVKVSSGTATRVLSPGQQVRGKGPILEMVAGVDVDQVLAWKNGAFSFRNADLPTVMRQLARWYDIEVEYTGAVPIGTFNGEIGRGLTLNQVLQGLAQARINYTIENSHKIVIRP